MFDTYRGIQKDPSYHAMKRFFDKERFDQAGEEKFKRDLDTVLNKAIDKIFQDYDYDTADNTYVVHSNSTNIGFAMEWDNCYVTVITFFPIKKSHTPKHASDIILMVEKDAIKKMGKQRIMEASEEGAVDHVSLYGENNDAIEVYFWEGKVYDICCDIVIVD